jgi:hypothetical protein
MVSGESGSATHLPVAAGIRTKVGHQQGVVSGESGSATHLAVAAGIRTKVGHQHGMV